MHQMQHSQHIHWHIKANGLPMIQRHCPKCGCDKPFRNSEKFRVNANKKNLDIWLIYRCATCNETYNLTVHERIKPSDLSPERLERFTKNDPILARELGFNNDLHRSSDVLMDYTQLDVEIDGPLPSIGSSFCVSLSMDSGLCFRVDWILSQKLQLSRSEVKRRIQAQQISAFPTPIKSLEKHKLTQPLTLKITL